MDDPKAIAEIMERQINSVKPSRSTVHYIYTNTTNMVKAMWLAQVELEAMDKGMELQASCLEVIQGWELYRMNYPNFGQYVMQNIPPFTKMAVVFMVEWKEDASIRSILDEAETLNTIEKHYMEVLKVAGQWRRTKMDAISHADSLKSQTK